MEFDNEGQFQEWANGLYKKIGIMHIHIPQKVRRIFIYLNIFGKAFHSGFPDNLCFYRGRCWGIELKMKEKKQGPGQIKFQENFEQQGFNYYLCYTDQEVMEALQKELKGLINVM